MLENLSMTDRNIFRYVRANNYLRYKNNKGLEQEIAEFRNVLEFDDSSIFRHRFTWRDTDLQVADGLGDLQFVELVRIHTFQANDHQLNDGRL